MYYNSTQLTLFARTFNALNSYPLVCPAVTLVIGSWKGGRTKEGGKKTSGKRRSGEFKTYTSDEVCPLSQMTPQMSSAAHPLGRNTPLKWRGHMPLRIHTTIGRLHTT